MEKFLEPDEDENGDDDDDDGDQEKKKKARQGKEGDDCAKHDGVCPTCSGTGWVESSDDDDDDRDSYEGDDPETILQQVTAGVEGVERRDLPDHASVKKLKADHKKTMDAIYAEEAEQLRNAYRR